MDFKDKAMNTEALSYKKGRVKIIDQSLLPERIKYIYLDNLKDLSKAVKELRVRGAPALGASRGIRRISWGKRF